MEYIIACMAIPTILLLIKCIYIFSVRHMNRNERLEPKRQDEPAKTVAHPVKCFVEENNLFFNRDSEAYSESDIKLMMRNAKDRLPLTQIYPYQENTTIRMSGFLYDEKSHYARMEFQLKTTYRTIERYVQRNYVRTPIYSDLKTKYKSIKKSLRVNADGLEGLSFPEDRILEMFGEEIVIRLNSVDLVPSWAINEWTDREATEYKKYLKEQVKKKEQALSDAVKERDRESPTLTVKIDRMTAKVEKLTTKYYKKKGNGKEKLAGKIAKLKEEVSEKKKRFAKLQSTVPEMEKAVAESKDKEIRINENINNLLPKLEKMVPRLSDLEEYDGFIPLSRFAIKPYEKIVGVYVIRNNKNGRVYVGQSKDVMRRIKQHFHGTVPANVIFAEDYYSTPEQEREYLFSVKIDELFSKDELDSVEKDLIEAYDAYTKGYNGTKGNN